MLYDSGSFDADPVRVKIVYSVPGLGVSDAVGVTPPSLAEIWPGRSCDQLMRYDSGGFDADQVRVKMVYSVPGLGYRTRSV